LLNLLYEGRHLSSSVRRKITVNVLTFFIQRLQTFFYFVTFFTFLNVFKRFLLGGRLFIYSAWYDVVCWWRVDVLEVNGLTVDWVSEHVYWTDECKRSVEVAEFNGSNRRLLVTERLSQPRGIYADPINGFVRASFSLSTTFSGALNPM